MISFFRPVMTSRPPRVEVAEVAGVEPSAGEGHGVDVGAVVVPGHDDGAANQDLAVRVLAVWSAGRVGRDADLDALERRPDRVDVGIAEPRGGGGSGALGQPVRLHDVEAHAEQIAADARIEAGAAAHHDAHAAADAPGGPGGTAAVRG